MKQFSPYPQAPVPVKSRQQISPAPFTGSVQIGGANVFIESDNLASLIACVGFALRAKIVERCGDTQKEWMQ